MGRMAEEERRGLEPLEPPEFLSIQQKARKCKPHSRAFDSGVLKLFS